MTDTTIDMRLDNSVTSRLIADSIGRYAMPSHTVQFYQVPIGAYYECNGNLCRKASTRTGYLINYKKTFYFSRVDCCKIVASPYEAWCKKD